MTFFKKAEGECAVLQSKGVFKQVDVYTRDGGLFAAYGGGFIRIMSDGTTSKQGVSVNALLWSFSLFSHLGRLVTARTNENTRSLTEAERQQLGWRN